MSLVVVVVLDWLHVLLQLANVHASGAKIPLDVVAKACQVVIEVLAVSQLDPELFILKNLLLSLSLDSVELLLLGSELGFVLLL